MPQYMAGWLTARRAQLFLTDNNVRVSEFAKVLAANRTLTQVFCEQRCSRGGIGFRGRS